MTSLFCRHNRFTAECPICSKNTVLARTPAERTKPAKPASTRSAKARPKTAAATVTRYPSVSVGPIEHEGRIYNVRLEQVPGGLRLGQWRSGELERKAVVLPASSVRELYAEAFERGFVKFELPDRGGAEQADAPPSADQSSSDDVAASPGRAGDMREELRLERVGGGFVRIARWVFWPGTGVGWELQEAPVMLPEKRFEQVLSESARKGLV